MFAKHLANYLRAGIPILQAIELAGGQGKRPHSRISAYTIQEVRRGIPLSRALAAFPRAYPDFYTHIIAIGEASGTLPDSLAYVSELTKKRADLTRKIISSLTYPACIALSTLGISGFLILYAFPKVVPLFRGLHTALPLTTRILMGLSSSVSAYGVELLVFLVICIALVFFSIRSRALRPRVDTFLLALPLLGTVLTAYYLAHIFHNLSLLLKSGIHLDEALLFTQKSISHAQYSYSLGLCSAAVLRGTKITTAFELFPHIYPPTVIQILRVGESTGSLSESASLVSDVYGESLDEQLERLTALIEPLLIAVLGGIVGFVSLAIISPMYSLTQALSG